MKPLAEVIAQFERGEISIQEFQWQGTGCIYKYGSQYPDLHKTFESLANAFNNLIEIIIYTTNEEDWRVAATIAAKQFLSANSLPEE